MSIISQQERFCTLRYGDWGDFQVRMSSILL